MYFPK
jgi:hypothetical protein